MTNCLTAIPKLEALSPLVFRVLGCNPGSFTLQGTNTYLVGAGKEKILIDTGERGVDEYVRNLDLALNDHLKGARIKQIVCTHWHHDHVGGVDELTKRHGNMDLRKFARAHGVQETFEPKIGVWKYLKDGEQLKIGGATLTTIFTPGHTDDHICLYLAEEEAVFSGDCMLGEGTAVFEDLFDYMQSLQKLTKLKMTKIYPGHGPVITNPRERIDFYIAHRNERERQILDALTKANSEKSNNKRYLTVAEIVDFVYPGLDESLRCGAENNVLQHVKKLKKEGKISKYKN
uniref:Beta-lactamase-like protein 2 homolog n=1 Tax=Romanomermis culicivorax TaxID=13658 RepID=A0A915IQE3_ROMCU